MKIACLFAASALASATAPPRISLSLDGQAIAYTVKETVEAPTGAVASVGDLHSNVGKTCQAGIDDAATCKYPVASAWDHHDKAVAVQQQIWKLTNTDSAPVELCNTEEGKPCSASLINYEEPAEYLFLYNAEDSSGQKAVSKSVNWKGNKHDASVTFNLLIDDLVKPQICYGQLYSQTQLKAANGALSCENYGFPSPDPSARVFTWEGGSSTSGFQLKKSLAHDDITYANAMPITYTVTKCNDATKPSMVAVEACKGESTTITVAPTWYGDKKSKIADVQAAVNQYVTGAKRSVGYVQIAMDTEDSAGIFGDEGQNNKAKTVYMAVKVVDTIAPAITVKDYSKDAVVLECGSEKAQSFYPKHDAGASYFESMALGAVTADCSVAGKNQCLTTSNLNDQMENSHYAAKSAGYQVVGEYQIMYSAKDASGNTQTKVRKIAVQDTSIPTIALKHQGGKVVAYQTHETRGSDAEPTEFGVSVSDVCDEHIGQTTGTVRNGQSMPDSVSTEWDVAFNSRKLGTYVKTYTVKDSSNNKAQTTRTYYVVDPEKPKITLEGSATEIIEATREEEYKDDGATCADFVDGQLNHRVRVGGDIVDLTIVGTYTVKYTCSDLTGNQAKGIERTVIVQDTTRPTVDILGRQNIKIEAGFPYTDAGATASDTLEGAYQNCGEDLEKIITAHKTNFNTNGAPVPEERDMKCLDTFGDSVNEYYEYNTASSCAAIFASTTEGANSGLYKIDVNSGEDIQHREVTCNMDNKNNVVTYLTATKYNCDGLQGFSAVTQTNSFLKRAILSADEQIAAGMLCVADITTPPTGVMTGQKADSCPFHNSKYHKCTRSGTYFVRYHVSDHAGNANLEATRTVTVADTLPPVISLHFKAKQNNRQDVIIQQSAGGQSTSDGAQMNPARFSNNNPYLVGKKVEGYKGALMAETTVSVNGWLIAAGVSAVAGMALLASSSKKTVTSVPV